MSSQVHLPPANCACRHCSCDSRQGPIGGPTRGIWCLDPRPPPLVTGSMYKKKDILDLGLNPHTAVTIRKKVAGGVEGSKLGENIYFIEGSFCLPK